MKYQRLTKEQLEELQPEFVNFLASQSITSDEWSDLKLNSTKVAEEELDIFSDLIWEKVLENASYLEHFSKNQLYLFNLLDDEINLIAVKIDNQDIDITTKIGYQWLRDHLMDDDVTFFNASKKYSNDKKMDIFKLIQEGAVITKGELYRYFLKLIN